MTYPGANCSQCTLYDSCNFRPVPGYTENAKEKVEVVFVADAPGHDEYIMGIPLIGDSGKLFNTIIAGNGLSREDVYCTNANLCRPLDNRTPTRSEVEACNNRLKLELAAIPNKKLIVCMGATAMHAVTGDWQAKITKKMFSIDYLEEYKCHVLYAYHPAAVLRQTGLFEDFNAVIKQAVNFLQGTIKEYVLPKIVVEDNTAKCLERLDFIEKNAEYIASDLETKGLNFRTDPILSVGMCWQENLSYIIPAQYLKNNKICNKLKELYESPKLKWIWHNGTFDVKFLRMCGINARIDEDTMLLHAQLDERSDSDKNSAYGSGKIHGLKTVGRKYLGAPDWEFELDDFKRTHYRGKKAKEFDYSCFPKEMLYKYHGYDCDATFKLFHLFVREIEEDYNREPSPFGYPSPMTAYRNIIIPATNALSKIEQRGVAVDIPYNRKLSVNLLEEMDKKEKEIIDFINQTNKKKQYCIESDKKQENKAAEEKGLTPININSTTQLASLLYDDLGYVYVSRSTDKEALEFLEKQGCTVVKLLREYRILAKRYGTYVKGLYDRIDPEEGIVRSNFLLTGTITGRLSSRDPNLQNILRDDNIKKQFKARPRHVFVASDYAQLEVRVAAYLTRDPALILAVKEDIHSTNCEIIFADYLQDIKNLTHRELVEFINRIHVLRDLVTMQKLYPNEFADVDIFRKKIKKELRQVSKPITFGGIYGLQAYTLATRDLQCPVEDAERYLEALLGRYVVLAQWIKRQHEIVLDTGIIDQPTGRRRRFPLTTPKNKQNLLNMAVNTPIQGFASDFNTVSISQLVTLMPQYECGFPLFPVHDQTNADVLEEKLDIGIALIKHTMENVVKDPEVKFPVDIKYGPNWGEGVPVPQEIIYSGMAKLGLT